VVQYNLKEILNISVLKRFPFSFLYPTQALVVSVMTLLVFYLCWSSYLCG